MRLSHQLESSRDMNKEGYMILGNVFECEDCKTRFNRPEMSHSYRRCGKDFNYKNIGYMKLKEFTKV